MFKNKNENIKNPKARILIVDDNNQNLKVLTKILEAEGYGIALAMEASQMFEYLDVEIPDLILLDIMLPDMDGYTACSKLKAIDEWKGIPVMFLTALTGTRNMIEGYRCGGSDFITKPFENIEVLQRVATQIELVQSKKELKKLRKEYDEQAILLQKQKTFLESIAVQDELTQVASHHYGKSQIENEMARFKRTGQLFSIALCDLDKVVYIQETFGHEVRDQMLKMLADYFMEKKRKQDLIVRWSDTQFMIVMPHTDLIGAKIFSERLCHNIEKIPFTFENHTLSITISVGVAEYNQTLAFEDVEKRVKDALESSVYAGGNQVVIDARYATIPEE